MAADESINHVSIKPPMFMEDNVQAWFSIMEAQFSIAKITVKETKFYHVLASLPPNIVTPITQSTLDSKDYDVLKGAVLSTYEKSKPELLDKLMSSTIMTGRPSIYLNELLSLSTKIGAGDDIVRHKFISALPNSISPIIASQGDLDFLRLGKMADELLIHMNRQESSQAHVNQLSSQAQQNRHSTSTNAARSSQQIPYGLRPFNKDQKPKVCRAHLWFGEKAKYCKPWCKWPNKNNSIQIQPSSRPSSPARNNNNSENC